MLVFSTGQTATYFGVLEQIYSKVGAGFFNRSDYQVFKSLETCRIAVPQQRISDITQTPLVVTRGNAPLNYISANE